MLWCPRTCLVSALSPPLPVQLKAVLFRQCIVVISGSPSKALQKMLWSHFLASCLLVNLLVQPSSSVGAGNKGTLCRVSRGLSANLETLANSNAHAFFPTPHTGATSGIDRPSFWTKRTVLWLRVLYSKYLDIFPSVSDVPIDTSEVRPPTFVKTTLERCGPFSLVVLSQRRSQVTSLSGHSDQNASETLSNKLQLNKVQSSLRQTSAKTTQVRSKAKTS